MFEESTIIIISIVLYEFFRETIFKKFVQKSPEKIALKFEKRIADAQFKVEESTSCRTEMNYKRIEEVLNC